MSEPIKNEKLQRFHSTQKDTAQMLIAAGRYQTTGNPYGVVPIISIEHSDMLQHMPDIVFEATIPVAARAISRRTHRLATDDEYAEFLRARDGADEHQTQSKQNNYYSGAGPEPKRVGRPKKDEE